MKTLLACSLGILLSACATMHFDNGPEMGNEIHGATYDHWHHVGVLSLIEFSDPENMSQLCDGKTWSSVKIEKGPLQALVSVLAGPFYSPWDVQYSCAASSHGAKKKVSAKLIKRSKSPTHVK